MQQEIDTHHNDIRQLGVRRLDSKKQIDSELSAIRIQINEASRNLAGQMRSFQEASQVYSPYTGRVLELRLSENTLVGAGAPILSIERIGADLSELEAHIYVPPPMAKKSSPTWMSRLHPPWSRVKNLVSCSARSKPWPSSPLPRRA